MSSSIRPESQEIIDQIRQILNEIERLEREEHSKNQNILNVANCKSEMGINKRLEALEKDSHNHKGGNNVIWIMQGL